MAVGGMFDEFTSTSYPKTCTILQYSGDLESQEKSNSPEVYFSYDISSPGTVVVYEEYLIYDTIGLIGSVGGTMGMFIGFSFSGTISQIIAYISKLRSKTF